MSYINVQNKYCIIQYILPFLKTKIALIEGLVLLFTNCLLKKYISIMKTIKKCVCQNNCKI